VVEVVVLVRKHQVLKQLLSIFSLDKIQNVLLHLHKMTP